MWSCIASLHSLALQRRDTVQRGSREQALSRVYTPQNIAHLTVSEGKNVN